MKHPTHYVERMLFSSSIALTVLAVAFLLLDIDSFTGKFTESKTAPVGNSCEAVFVGGRSCSGGNFGVCDPGFIREFMLTQKGEGLCCCRRLT